MARYKPIDTSPRFLAIDWQRQLPPRSFEHALNDLIDHELGLSSFVSSSKIMKPVQPLIRPPCA